MIQMRLEEKNLSKES